jgi:hypothetical protein
MNNMSFKSINVLVLIYILRIRWHILIAIIFIRHITGCPTVSVINSILIDWYCAALYWSRICCGIIETIIEHHHPSSPWFSNCRYTANFLLRMYWLVWTVMFHFIISILSKPTWALTWYYHLLLHTWWRATNLMSLQCSSRNS